MKMLGLIVARGGSKGLPGKNIISLAGRPLIAWTIKAAQECAVLDKVVLSTDDLEIARVAKTFNCEAPFIRPARLSGDEVGTMAVIEHALGEIRGYDYLALLQPTSPLRQARHISEAFSLLLDRGAPSVVSVCQSSEKPYWMCEIDEHGRIAPLFENIEKVLRRQDMPDCYLPNGAVYIAKTDWLLSNGGFFSAETLAYVMSREHSIDIDTELDLEIAKQIMRQSSNEQIS